MMIGRGERRVELNGAVVVGSSGFQIAQCAVRVTQLEIGNCQIRVELDGARVVGDGGLKIPHRPMNIPSTGVGHCNLRVKLDRAIELCKRCLQPEDFTAAIG